MKVDREFVIEALMEQCADCDGKYELMCSACPYVGAIDALTIDTEDAYYEWVEELIASELGSRD